MKTLLFLSLFLLFSCQSDEATQVSLAGHGNQYAGEIKSLVKENEGLQDEMARDVVFSGTSPAQWQRFKDILVETRVLLLQLLNNPDSKTALNTLTQRHAQLQKMPIQARDEEFIRSYIVGLEQILDKIEIHQGREVEVLPVITVLSKIELKNDFDSYIKQYDNDNAAEWTIQSYKGDEYAQAKGFDAKNTGVSLLISPELELGAGDNILKVNHTVNHYKPYAAENNFIQILVGVAKENVDEIEWKVVNFEKGGHGNNNWDRVQTSWESLGLEETKIRVAFRYESQFYEEEGKDPVLFAPTWQILDFSIGVRE